MPRMRPERCGVTHPQFPSVHCSLVSPHDMHAGRVASRKDDPLFAARFFVWYDKESRHDTPATSTDPDPV